MTTFNSKRFAKLAGLLKEASRSEKIGPRESQPHNRVEESKKYNKKVLSSSPASISLKAAMKSCDHLNECGCQMQSPFDAPEHEPQGYMLVQNLRRIAHKAEEMSYIARVEDDAEPWVESKINSAADDISAVYDYIKYGRSYNKHDAEEHHHEKDMPHDDFSDLDMHVVNTYKENE